MSHQPPVLCYLCFHAVSNADMRSLCVEADDAAECEAEVCLTAQQSDADMRDARATYVRRDEAEEELDASERACAYFESVRDDD